MSALLRKEWRQLQPGATLAAVLVAGIWLLLAPGVPIAPSPTLQVAWFAFALLAGTVVGYYQLGVERAGGTWSLLVQRSLGPGQILAAKLAAGWAALALILAVPVLLGWAGARGAWLAEQSPLRERRAVELLALCAAALPAHGLGALATTWRLPRGLRGGAALLGVVGLSLAGSAVLIAEWGGFAGRVAGFALGCAVLGAALAALALRNSRGGDDLDVPAPAGRTAALAAAAGVFLVVPLLVVLVLLEVLLVREIYGDYGFSARDGFVSGDVKFEKDERGAIEGGFELEPTGSSAWLDQPVDLSPEPVFHVGERWVELLSTTPGFTESAFRYREMWLNRTSCTLHFIDRDDPDVSGNFDATETVRPADEVPLSRETLVAAGVEFRSRTRYVRQAGVLLYDPHSERLWQLDRETDLEPVVLPDGATTVRLEPRTHRLARSTWSNFGPVFVTESGRFVWHETAFTSEDVSKIARWPSFDLDVLSGHTVTPTIRVRGAATGALLFESTFRPRGPTQTVRYLALQALVLLRPPVVVVSSFARDGALAGDAGDLLAEQQVWEGHRLDLVVLNVLVAAGFGAHAARRLWQLGASRARRGAWIAAVLALGYAGYVVFRLVEPRPRRAGTPEPETQPVPLLVDRASPAREVATCARS